MKKLFTFILTASIALAAAAAFGLSKDEAFLKKLPSVPATWSEAVKLTNQMEKIIREIDAEISNVQKSAFNKGSGSGEITAADVNMADYSAGAFSRDDILLMSEVQSIQSEWMADLQNGEAAKNPLGDFVDELKKEMGLIDEVYRAKYATVNDGEGSTEADVAREKLISVEYAAAQKEQIGKSLKKLSEISLESLKKLSARAAKGGPVADKAFSKTKNQVILGQAGFLRTTTLSALREIAVRQNEVYSYPIRQTRY
jgi:hypothetical protein